MKHPTNRMFPKGYDDKLIRNQLAWADGWIAFAELMRVSYECPQLHFIESTARNVRRKCLKRLKETE
jgi:hypothetical protein